MVEILKFIYFLIIFVYQFLVVVKGNDPSKFILNFFLS